MESGVKQLTDRSSSEGEDSNYFFTLVLVFHAGLTCGITAFAHFISRLLLVNVDLTLLVSSLCCSSFVLGFWIDESYLLPEREAVRPAAKAEKVK